VRREKMQYEDIAWIARAKPTSNPRRNTHKMSWFA
jgi:hypothetical protein